MARQKTECSIEGDLRVKDILAERGILMKDFAEQIGVTRETLTRALKGNPQYSTLKAIADGLGLSVPELFREHDTVKNTKPEDIRGCIFINNEAHLVYSLKDIKSLLTTLDDENGESIICASEKKSESTATILEDRKQTKKYKAIILDFDRTLFDTSADDSLRKNRKGKDIVWEEVYSIIPQYRLYDGWREVFQYAEENDIKIAVISTAKTELIKRTFDHFRLSCDAIIGWQLYLRKPDGRLVDMALKKIGVDKEDVLSVGDSVVDRQMAENGGVDFIGCIWDCEPEMENELRTGMAILNPAELIGLLRNTLHR